MTDNKAQCMGTAKKYGRDYWDGDRRFGYGGYRYDGRWGAVAQTLIKNYGLKDGASILDIGCGKGYLLYEFKTLLPKARVAGFDISDYAIENAKEEVKPYLFRHRAQDAYPFADGEFDLAVSLTTLHNLEIFDLSAALKEMERVGRNKYIAVESFRSNAELFNLECWALTCESFYTPRAWTWLFEHFGYSGDYEFIYFE
jgi:ubiquinone/menaquinone biosynthesis C-methylase UbiE